MTASLEAIIYKRGELKLLDQRLLPLETVYIDIPGPDAAFTAIRDMVVRGAPAIGVTAALATAADLHNKLAARDFKSATDVESYVVNKMEHLVESRPTAVNLMDACSRISSTAQASASAQGATAESIVNQIIEFAEEYFAEDVRSNKAMGRFGADALKAAAKASGRDVSSGLSVLTHCNTGSLATAGFGTALGVIRTLAGDGDLQQVYPTETRPYNQGARLTAFELQHDGLPATLIADSAACSLMAAGRVSACVVGADRVAANGDTANKVGTASLATIAKAHNVPFFIAAPTTTLDPGCSSGAGIVIEQRPSEELTHFRGQRVVAQGVGVWNPSFDVTPCALIAGIVTEKGLITKEKDGSFDVTGFLRQHQVELNRTVMGSAGQGQPNGGAKATGDPQALTLDDVKEYVSARPHLRKKLGPPGSEPSWSVREVGDGNINFVFIVEGPDGGLCLKQGLGFVRCVGESWPLSQDRVRFEAETMIEVARHCPQHVPEIFEYDPALSIISMRYIEPPHAILRRGLLDGLTYPSLATHMGQYLASSLFNTSALKLSGPDFRSLASHFTNPAMCELTEGVIFVDPLCDAKLNRWTSPQLDAQALALRADAQAKAAAARLKGMFCCRQEALLHGDLHLGSIMATPGSTFVIDAEFAFPGPIAFDVAKFVFDLALSYFALEGHEEVTGASDSRQQQGQWLLQCMVDTWDAFRANFLSMWDAQVEKEGAACELTPATLFGKEAPNGPQALKEVQELYMSELWQACVSFGGIFIIRRLVGIAHVLEMESIQDADVRAGCESRALSFGREMLVNAAKYPSPQAVVEAAVCAAKSYGK